jgi:putative membrane protein
MGWHGGMMGGGYSLGWLFMIVLWVVLIGVIVWLVVKLLPGSGRRGGGLGSPQPDRSESPEEMLDRMFVTGEIDEATYRARRTALSDMRGPR